MADFIWTFLKILSVLASLAAVVIATGGLVLKYGRKMGNGTALLILIAFLSLTLAMLISLMRWL